MKVEKGGDGGGGGLGEGEGFFLCTIIITLTDLVIVIVMHSIQLRHDYANSNGQTPVQDSNVQTVLHKQHTNSVQTQ